MPRNGGYQPDPFVAEIYDHIPPYGNRPDMDVDLEMTRESGGPGLELGCGTGRVRIPIPPEGFCLSRGVDFRLHPFSRVRSANLR